MSIVVNPHNQQEEQELLAFLNRMKFDYSKEEIGDQHPNEIETGKITIPDWQMDIVRKRLANYKNNPDQGVDFDIAMDDIEKGL